jgi:hypothetical protein
MNGTIAQDKLQSIVDRLRAGAALIKESLELGFTHNGPLRAALKGLLGEAGYDELMQKKRPTTKSGVPVSSVARPLPDDTGLPIVTSMNKSDGWTWRHVGEHETRAVEVLINKGTKDEGKAVINDSGDQILIVKSPEGVEYVAASAFEKADLLRAPFLSPKDPPLRFVQYERSEFKKQRDRFIDQGEETLERGEAALERKRARVNGEQPPPTLTEVAKAKKPRPPKKMTEAQVIERGKRDHEVIVGKSRTPKKTAKVKTPTKAVKKAAKGKKK